MKHIGTLFNPSIARLDLAFWYLASISCSEAGRNRGTFFHLPIVLSRPNILLNILLTSHINPISFFLGGKRGLASHPIVHPKSDI